MVDLLLNIIIESPENKSIRKDFLDGFSAKYRESSLKLFEEIPCAASSQNSKGDPITIEAIALGISTVLLPSLVSFAQEWVTNHRRISIEAPNGAKVEFTPNKKFSDEEILAFLSKLNEVK